MKKVLVKKIVIVCITFILLFLLCVLEKYWGILIRTKMSSTISFSWLIYLYSFVIFFLTGVVFGLDFFINELNKQGQWKVNLLKICIYGIPALIFASYVIVVVPIPFLSSNLLYYRVSNINLFINFAQTFLGYTLITSFYKK